MDVFFLSVALFYIYILMLITQMLMDWWRK